MLRIRLFAVAAIVEHGPGEGITVAGFESAMRWPGIALELGSKASHCDSSASTCIRLLIPALRDQGADSVGARDLPRRSWSLNSEASQSVRTPQSPETEDLLQVLSHGGDVRVFVRR